MESNAGRQEDSHRAVERGQLAGARYREGDLRWGNSGMCLSIPLPDERRDNSLVVKKIIQIYSLGGLAAWA
jgi:hypothetical protein